MREVKSQFKGLNPSTETREKILNLVESLKYLLPPESDIKVSIARYSKGLEGSLVVHSELGDFKATCQNNEVINLVKDLRGTLKQQVHKQKSNWQAQKKAA